MLNNCQKNALFSFIAYCEEKSHNNYLWIKVISMSWKKFHVPFEIMIVDQVKLETAKAT